MLEFFGDLEKYYFGNRPLSLKCKKSSVLRSQNIFSYLILRYYRDLVMFFFFLSPLPFSCNALQILQLLVFCKVDLKFHICC